MLWRRGDTLAALRPVCHRCGMAGAPVRPNTRRSDGCVRTPLSSPRRRGGKGSAAAGPRPEGPPRVVKHETRLEPSPATGGRSGIVAALWRLARGERSDDARVTRSRAMPGATSVRLERYSSSTSEWSEWQDLNLRPPRPERGALPDCATLRMRLLIPTPLWHRKALCPRRRILPTAVDNPLFRLRPCGAAGPRTAAFGAVRVLCRDAGRAPKRIARRSRLEPVEAAGQCRYRRRTPITAFGASPSGKAADFDSAIRWFESSRPIQTIRSPKNGRNQHTLTVDQGPHPLPGRGRLGRVSACLAARVHALRAPFPGLTEPSSRASMTTRTARRRAASGGASRQGWTSARMMPSPANRAATESTTETRA